MRRWRIARKSPQPDSRRAGRHVSDNNHEIIFDRAGKGHGVGNLYYGADVFLLLGGPSASDLPLNLLRQRGCLVMAVNNAAATFRPHLWTHGDPPQKFHQSIWRDPAVLKFVPKAKLWNMLREKVDGKIREANEQVFYQPGLMSYQRNTCLDPENFLTEGTINFGNSNKWESRNDYPKVLSTMFSALRLCYYLGCFRVFLVGCDFYMEYGKSPYSFDEEKHHGAYSSNNNSYRKISVLMAILKPHFDKAGFEVYNCNPDSGLSVFPFVSFDDAVGDATSRVAQDPLDTKGWYTK